MGRIGAMELTAIIAVFALIFGTKKLPELGKSFGETISNFKTAAKGEDLDG